MAEVVGAAASVLTLTIFAYGTSKTLYEAVASFKSHRKTVKEVQADLASLTAVLDSIRDQVQRSNNTAKFESLRQPLSCCTTVCQEMQEMLKVCTAHSKGDNDSIRDWISMQFREKSFDDVKKRLASYKATLCIAFALVNSHDHAITQDSLGDLKDSIDGTKQDLQDELDQVQSRITAATASIQNVLQADRAQLRACLDSLQQSQSRAENLKPTVTISSNRAGQASRAIFGTDTTQPNFDLNVVGNEAQGGATMAAGVHSPETLRALLQNSPNPDLMTVLQNLQNTNTSKFTNPDMLRSATNTGAPPSNAGGTSHLASTNRQLLPSSVEHADQLMSATRDGTEQARVAQAVVASRGDEVHGGR